MFFLNLSALEFFALFTAVSGVAVALYLLDRSKKKLKVPTLRFWKHSEKPPIARHRRRIQQPWSLLLQVLGMLLLLLAISQLRIGSPDRASRDHVLLLDTSAWMSARAPRGTLMDEAKAQARAYVRALPPSDRVMLVRADELSTPATVFEVNRRALEDAIRRSQPGSASLHIEQALNFALEMQKLHGRRAGEIVYAGASRIDAGEAPGIAPVPGLRILPVSEVTENVGLRKINLRRSMSDTDLWEIFASVKNYGKIDRVIPLVLHFGGAPIGSARLSIPAGGEQNQRFEFRTKAAGWMEARLLVKDAIASDDRAVLELPAQKSLHVAVYSDQPESLRPLLASNPWIQAKFYPTAAYNPENGAQIVVLDRFKPPAPPKADSIWIEPPSSGSPVPSIRQAANVALSSWRTDHPLSAGLRTKDLRLESTQVYGASPDFAPIADVEGGAAIVARSAEPKIVVFGFNPGRSALRYELAAPLLFANLFQWMAPEIFRRAELNGDSAGGVNVTLDPGMEPASVRVLGEGDTPLPFTVQGRNLRFFGGVRGIVRVLAGDKEMVYSLSLPDVAEAKWTAPKGARRGIPKFSLLEASSRDIWQILALLGALCLLAEWFLYGRFKLAFAPRIGGFLTRFRRAA